MPHRNDFVEYAVYDANWRLNVRNAVYVRELVTPQSEAKVEQNAVDRSHGRLQNHAPYGGFTR